MTAGYNEVINQRQFGVPGLRWPTEYRYPDRTYRDELRLDVGGTGFELRHEKGETDDHTVTWMPRARVLCCGDLFIWASPNAGNPQKVQRYPARVGGRAAPDDRPRTRVPAARPRPAGHWRGPDHARR